ncbi:MAG: hypothetical protein JJ900_15620 [Rhodospirillales bacterium]|nr:hypothetical protein [Rhodospirillales bacterium]MBO6788276.1 hypothetical protein [Rhodospirillales bacterium]
MPYKVLILGASYGSLFGTKLAMAGHDVTLVCRRQTADLINDEGTEVRVRLKGEETHRAIRSRDLPGRIDAKTPEEVIATNYDLVCLAMQEPQYCAHEIWTLLIRIADAGIPSLSIMNMPPLAYLKRIPGLDCTKLDACYSNARVWDHFDPDLVSLCSPDPQAFRPPDEKANVLHVGLPTNFKAAVFGNEAANDKLRVLAADIDSVRLDGKDVPVKLRVFDSLFVPFAKWSMLLAGNYRCITEGAPISIRDAVHGDLDLSRRIYDAVTDLTRRLGADAADAVPFEKYAAAAENLLKPSSAARAVDAGAPFIERVDLLVHEIARSLGIANEDFMRIAETVNAQLANNNRQIA